MSEPWYDELRGTEEPSDEGGFTLDRDKAREKLSRFRLPSPHYYVLEFIQAAQLLGAQRIEITVDADEVRMRFDGQLLTRDDLQNIYRTGFAGGPDAKRRALRRLAIGLSAVWGLDPAEAWVYSSSREQSLCAEFSRDGDDHIDECPEYRGLGNIFYVRERMRLSHVVDFFHKLRGALPEEALIRERCAWSDVLIEVNTEQVSRGMHLPPASHSQVPVDSEHEYGVIGLAGDILHSSSTIRILTHGVSISVKSLPDLPFGICGVISSDRVEKSLSQTEIADDDNWADIRDNLVHDGAFRALQTYLDDHSEDQVAIDAAHLRDIAAAVWAYQPPGAEAAYAAVIEAFEGLAIWKFAHDPDSAETTLTSLAHLDELFEGEDVPISAVDHRGRGLDTLPKVVLVPSPYRHIFEDVFGERLVSVTDQVQRVSQRTSLLEELEQLGRPAAPHPQGCLAFRRLEREGVVGIVGVSDRRRGARAYSTIEWTNDQLILDRDTSGLDLGGVDIWFGGALTLRMSSPHFEVSDHYVDLACELIFALPSIVAEAADGLKKREIVRWLNDLTDPATPGRLAEDLQVPAATFEAYRATRRASSESTGWLSLAGESHPDTHAQRRARLDALGELADRPLVASTHGESLSLNALFEHKRQGHTIVADRDVDVSVPGEVPILGGWKTQLVLERFLGPIDSEAPASRPVGAAVEREASSSRGSRPPARPHRDAEPTGPSAHSEPKHSVQPRAEGPDLLRCIEDRVRESALQNISVQIAEVGQEIPARLRDRRFLVNPAHPIIADALEHSDSARAQRWARTALYSAIAADGGTDEREFAFRQLARLLSDD